MDPHSFLNTMPYHTLRVYIYRKQCLWDVLHIEWEAERIYYKERAVPLREHLNVPLADKTQVKVDNKE